METMLTGVDVAAITSAAGPLAAVGVGLALAFVVAPKIAVRVISFVKRIT
jgi:hypothetical protein